MSLTAADVREFSTNPNMRAAFTTPLAYHAFDDMIQRAADRIEALEAALTRLNNIDKDACDEAVNRAYGGDRTIGEAFRLILDSQNIPALISQTESSR